MIPIGTPQPAVAVPTAIQNPNSESQNRAAALRWLLAFVALGLLWRLVRYVLAFPIWQDEAYLGISILHRDCAALWREPLEYLQIAPLFYLWLQRAVVERLGGDEYAIRLVALVAGCLTLLIFSRLAWRRFPPLAAAVAVGIFAGSYVLVRHTVEAKQYATDGFFATLLLALGLWWSDAPQRTSRGYIAAAVAAVGVWASYPLILVASGIGLALLPTMWRSGQRRAWLVWTCYCGTTAASFLGFYFAFAADQSARAAGTWLESYWNDAFLPRDSVWSALWWLLEVHTGRMLAYPLGGPHFASICTTLLCIVGTVALFRASQRVTLLVLLAPILPALLAAALRRYPYGDSARVCIYLAPTICLLAGAGAAVLIDKVRTPRFRMRTVTAVGVGLILLPVGGIAFDLVHPYKLPQYAAGRDAVRRLASEIRPTDRVAIANARHDRLNPPDSPEFPPPLRYSLELWTGVPPHWCEARPPPADTRWLLTFFTPRDGPQRGRVEELLAPAGLRIGDFRAEMLWPAGGAQLGIYRCEPLAVSDGAPASGR